MTTHKDQSHSHPNFMERLMMKLIWKASGMQGLSGKTLEQYQKEQEQKDEQLQDKS